MQIVKRWLSGQYWLRTIAPVAALTVAIATVYANSFVVPFLYDDLAVVLNNQSIRDLKALPSVLSPPGHGSTVQSRPLVNLTLAINYALNKNRPWGYHAFNLAVHILASLALFGLVRRTLAAQLASRTGVRQERESIQAPWSDLQTNPSFTQATLPAFLVALVWGIHPLQTMAVTYISQRAEGLMGLMYLATLYCFARGLSLLKAQAAEPARAMDTARDRISSVNLPRPGQIWIATAVFFCALGMACKEVMVTAPLMTLAYDRAFFAPSWREVFRKRKSVHAWLFATWLVRAGLELLQGGERNAQTGFGALGDSWRYLLTQAEVIRHYLRLALWPDQLCLDYYGWPLARSPDEVWLSLLVIGGLVAATAFLFWRAPQWGFLGVWFFLALAPTSSIMPIVDRASEHRMYLSLAAVVCVIVLPVEFLARQWAQRLKQSFSELHAFGLVTLLMLTVGAVTALGVRTAWRNWDYRSNLSIWLDTIAKRPNNPRANMNVGVLYGLVGHPRLSIQYLLRTQEVDPNYEPAAVLSNLGSAYMIIGEYDEAMRLLETSIMRDPDYASAYFNRANLKLKLGLTNEAAGDFLRTIARDPDFAQAYAKLGALYREQGRHERAIVALTEAIERDPCLAAAYNARARAWLDKGEVEKARQDIAKVRSLGKQPDPEVVRLLNGTSVAPDSKTWDHDNQKTRAHTN